MAINGKYDALPKLEEVLGDSSIKYSTTLPDNIDDNYKTSDLSLGTMQNAQNAKSIDFGSLSNISLLKGNGFDSTCATCNNHYSLQFVSGNSIEEIKDGDNRFLYIGVDVSMPIKNFVEYLFNTIKASTNFTDHYTQYYYDGNTTLYILDNRERYDSDFNDFDTNVYIGITSINAVYKGPKIKMSDTFDFNDIEVTATLNNGTIELAEYITDYQVLNLYTNDYSNYVLTKDQKVRILLDVTIGDENFKLTQELDIPVIEAVLTAKYNGPEVDLGLDFDKNDLELYIEWPEINEKEIPTKYHYETLVTEKDSKFIAYSYEPLELQTNFNVPGYTPLCVANYKGKPLVVSTAPKKEDFDVRIHGLKYEYIVPIDRFEIYHNEANYAFNKYSDVFYIKVPKNIYKINPEYNISITIKTLDNLISLQCTLYHDTIFINADGKATLDPNKIMNIRLNSNLDGFKYLNGNDCTFSIDEFYLPGVYEIGVTYKWYYHNDLFEYVSDTINLKVESEYERIIAWYEEFPIETINDYNPYYVVIYAFPYVGDWIRIDPFDPNVSYNSLTVKEPYNPYHYYPPEALYEKETWYKVTYTSDSGKSLSDIYPVVGVKSKKHIEKEFKVLYYNKWKLTDNNIDKWEDKTEDFEEYFTIGKVFLITWQSFVNAARVIDRTGQFKIIAPPLSGLDVRYWSEWDVFVDEQYDITATMSKIFDEEDISLY